MALSLRFLGQASRQASQIATPTALTPRALASGAASGAVSPRTPRSPRMSTASAGMPCFGSCVDVDAKPNSRQGSFVGGLDNLKTPPGSFLGENINHSTFAESRTLPGFGQQEMDIFKSFIDDEQSPFLGEFAAEDASTRAGSSKAGHESPQFGEIDADSNFAGTDSQGAGQPYGRARGPMLLGRRRDCCKAHDLRNEEVFDVDDQANSVHASIVAPHVAPHMAAAQAARDAFMTRQARRSSRRIA